ncbi:MAG: Asp-tRNA(Asn)/Glu-tRNA(Gln) amidotransferase subunit GatC [Deltaproteobacteria bacterium]|nr:Asp-tRNA(Asn)/Glu-tRNA(Gln) amidotransferase subunit GatC [Deltaproteobacteria bacterium]
MKIGKAEVAHIANLSRLEFGDAEMELFTSQLNDILLYMEKLSAVDTASVMPATTQEMARHNAFREDVVAPSLSSEEALRNAPDATGDCIRVPKVVE